MAARTDQPHLHDSLRREILTDVQFERVLGAFRKGFLEGRSTDYIPFMVSVACQCFNNEYIYPVTKEEQDAVSRLKERFASVRDLIVYAMYEPLWTVREAALRFGLEAETLPRKRFLNVRYPSPPKKKK